MQNPDEMADDPRTEPRGQDQGGGAGPTADLSAPLAITRERPRPPRFAPHIVRRHKQAKTGLWPYLRQTALINVLIAPVIYGLALPIGLLDLCVSLYQRICFPVWRIDRVRRGDHIVIDRHLLAYLNGIEKLNCVYCGYANGVIAYAREVASRTEQYWCPIKHAADPKSPHRHYDDFLGYGDIDDLESRRQALRDKLE